MDNASFGTLLREYRLSRGLSQESLAERAAMSVNGISALERGANQAPQRRTLELLVGALELNADEMRRLEEAATRPSRPRRSGAPRGAADDLPHPFTAFFGRAQEVAAVAGFVLERRLVTLTGPGGIGKTTLALKVAQESARHFARVLFVDLAPLREPQSVMPAIAALEEKVRSTDSLVVIDNCEHVAEPAAAAIQALLNACARARVLATSRQSLSVPGEQMYRVPSLETGAAVELFTERAKRADASIAFSSAETAAIVRIVTRLEGIALAIELAAGWVNVLSLAQLEEHLCERLDFLSGRGASTLPRQRTMRAAIDWSYELLDERERQMFRRLSVFPASFTLDAAQAICADPESSRWHVFETLASLADKSLVNTAADGGVQRYRLLETTRAYALERLCEHEEAAALSGRHAQFYEGLAENAAAALCGAASTAQWARSLEPDLENFRSALDWTLHDRADVLAGARMLFNLQELWIVEGLASEAARKANAALQRADDLPNALRAGLWLTIARMRQQLFAHPNPMLEAARNARDLYERSNDRGGLAMAVRQQAAAYMRLGAYDQARREFSRSLEIFRELGDSRMVARGLGYLASLLQVKGEYAQAREMLLEVLGTASATGDDRMIPTVRMNLAETEFALGMYASAAERARENLSNDIICKSSEMLATQQANLSAYLLALGQTKEAQSMAMASIENAAEPFIAVPLQHFAASVARANPEMAAKLWGYVEKAFAAAAFPGENTERFTREHLTLWLHNALDAQTLSLYRGQGAAMQQRQILELARGKTALPPLGAEGVPSGSCVQQMHSGIYPGRLPS